MIDFPFSAVPLANEATVLLFSAAKITPSNSLSSIVSSMPLGRTVVSVAAASVAAAASVVGADSAFDEELLLLSDEQPDTAKIIRAENRIAIIFPVIK